MRGGGGALGFRPPRGVLVRLFAKLEDRCRSLTALGRGDEPSGAEILDEPPPLSLTGLVDAMVLSYTIPTAVGISRRSTLRAALLSAGDPSTGLHEVRQELASSGYAAHYFLFQWFPIQCTAKQGGVETHATQHAPQSKRCYKSHTPCFVRHRQDKSIRHMVDDVTKHGRDSIERAFILCHRYHHVP